MLSGSSVTRETGLRWPRVTKSGWRNSGEASYSAAQPSYTPDYSSTEDTVMDGGSSYSGTSPFSKY